MSTRSRLAIIGGVAVVTLGIVQMVARYYEVPQAALSTLSVVSIILLAPVCWMIGTMIRSGEIPATRSSFVATFIQAAAIFMLACEVAIIYSAIR
jgi:hypothetical protein